jgi:hypothetical protein
MMDGERRVVVRGTYVLANRADRHTAWARVHACTHARTHARTASVGVAVADLEPEPQHGGDGAVDEGVPEAHGGLGEHVEEEEEGEGAPGKYHLAGAVDCKERGGVFRGGRGQGRA